MQQQSKSTEVMVMPAKKAMPKKSIWRKFLTLLSLIIAVLANIGVFYIWQQLQMNEQQNIKQIVALQQDVSKMSVLLVTHQRAWRGIEQNMQTITNQAQRNNADWTLLETDYLLKLAAFNLMFEHNVPLAQQLLVTADQRLQALNDPALWPVRQVLAEDITRLNATPKVDLPGVVARLGALAQQAEQLPQLPVTAPSTPSVTPMVDTSASYVDKLRHFVAGVGHALSTMVTITRDGDKFVPALLTTEQHTYLVTNIQSQLTLAQWAVIRRQDKIYQQTLTQVTDWLEHYYSTTNPAVKGMLQDIAALKTLDINPPMPDISHSLEALQKASGTKP